MDEELGVIRNVPVEDHTCSQEIITLRCDNLSDQAFSELGGADYGEDGRVGGEPFRQAIPRPEGRIVPSILQGGAGYADCGVRPKWLFVASE
eukprot:688977-Pleurochrysis_carterae.AAC.1